VIEVDVRLRRGAFELQAALAAPSPGVTSLFGRSGSGKTTLINLIAGLLRPDHGRIAVNGTVLHDSALGMSVPAHRRRIGYVFQDGRLFPHLDVAGNLRYGLRRSAARTADAGFSDAVALLGLENLLQRRPHQLSGGERQRVAVGRALLSQPRLLLLDEPLASLDRARREELLPWFERLRDRHSIPIVHVSHEFDEAIRLANHMVLLERGRVVAQGEVTELSLRPELRDVLGPDAVGAVVDGLVEIADSATGLARVRIGRSVVAATAPELRSGQRVRVQLLARDLILAVSRPVGLSVRNEIEGTVRALTDDGPEAVLVEVDVGGPVLLARVTRAAAAELAIERGRRIWVLVKALSLRGHVYSRV
jgi:molybdate transport system ATP-binding protein